jgi:TPR repeat protein
MFYLTRVVGLAFLTAGSLSIPLGLHLAESSAPQMNRRDTAQKHRERNAEDEYQLGMKYTRGIEVTQDYAMAAKLFEKAAEQGAEGTT